MRFPRRAGCITQAALMIRNPGCGSQRLLLCRSHPAGRGPSLASLFPPQAAVGSAAVRIHPPSPEKISAKQKIQYPVRILDFLVGAGGFEPPKQQIYSLSPLATREHALIHFRVRCRTTCLVYHSFPVLSTAILIFPKKKTRSPTLPFPAPRPSAAQVLGRHDGYFHIRSPE